ncbi:dephospho-CoA kinase [Phakopsora pachyrhizi]|uniref:Dephospho-CoA kinase n=1 Tax=Phakopsora pachyrhizi TaxID=170000 RepID=A0AAV0BFC6_PHAPC|nr:dephospho-CoA kinase [Phakopsora pachyrhizi]CAH7684912.1 dephospho-CoA kinase [Phakopsora pachyrhizi]
MLVIGLTGGIASGKSTVAGLLKSYGIPIIDLDQLARKVVEPGSKALRSIKEHFKDEHDLINPNNQSLNRERLGQIVFNDPAQRRWLDRLLHPLIRRLILYQLIKNWIKGYKITVIDSPLLVETGMWKFCGKVIIVYCSEQLQTQRLKARNPNLSESDVKSRISSQTPLKSKLIYGDHIIENSGSLTDLEKQVERLVWKFEKDHNRLIWFFNWVVPPIGLLNGFLVIVYKALIKKTPKSDNIRRRANSHHNRGYADLCDGTSKKFLRKTQNSSQSADSNISGTGSIGFSNGDHH